MANDITIVVILILIIIIGGSYYLNKRGGGGDDIASIEAGFKDVFGSSTGDTRNYTWQCNQNTGYCSQKPPGSGIGNTIFQNCSDQCSQNNGLYRCTNHQCVQCSAADALAKDPSCKPWVECRSSCDTTKMRCQNGSCVQCTVADDDGTCQDPTTCSAQCNSTTKYYCSPYKACLPCSQLQLNDENTTCQDQDSCAKSCGQPFKCVAGQCEYCNPGDTSCQYSGKADCLKECAYSWSCDIAQDTDGTKYRKTNTPSNCITSSCPFISKEEADMKCALSYRCDGGKCVACDDKTCEFNKPDTAWDDCNKVCCQGGQNISETPSGFVTTSDSFQCAVGGPDAGDGNDDGDSKGCWNNNYRYDSFGEAYTRCAQKNNDIPTEGGTGDADNKCKYIQQQQNGKWYLRSTDDPKTDVAALKPPDGGQATIEYAGCHKNICPPPAIPKWEYGVADCSEGEASCPPGYNNERNRPFPTFQLAWEACMLESECDIIYDDYLSNHQPSGENPGGFYLRNSKKINIHSSTGSRTIGKGTYNHIDSRRWMKAGCDAPTCPVPDGSFPPAANHSEPRVPDLKGKNGLIPTANKPSQGGYDNIKDAWSACGTTHSCMGITRQNVDGSDSPLYFLASFKDDKLISSDDVTKNSSKWMDFTCTNPGMSCQYARTADIGDKTGGNMNLHQYRLNSTSANGLTTCVSPESASMYYTIANQYMDSAKAGKVISNVAPDDIDEKCLSVCTNSDECVGVTYNFPTSTCKTVVSSGFLQNSNDGMNSSDFFRKASSTINLGPGNKKTKFKDATNKQWYVNQKNSVISKYPTSVVRGPYNGDTAYQQCLDQCTTVVAGDRNENCTGVVMHTDGDSVSCTLMTQHDTIQSDDTSDIVYKQT